MKGRSGESESEPGTWRGSVLLDEHVRAENNHELDGTMATLKRKALFKNSSGPNDPTPSFIPRL